jgi:formylglycine-generating enzyme required for sulfatase activity
VDGNFVGNTPAKVNLPFGKHVIEVKRKGYNNWKKELQVSVGGEFNLDALLEKEQLPGDVWQEPGTGIEFVWIPKGCFNMGSQGTKKGAPENELPSHEVCVDGFWMSKYEITNKQFRMFKRSHNSGAYHGVETLNEDSQPVVNITWSEARAFANWLSNKGRNIFRLPTEAEWEYACRAGAQTDYFWGDNDLNTCQYANVVDLSKVRRNPSWYLSNFNCDDQYVVSSPVGSFKPNIFGLYDMIGNADEMVEDHYSFYKPTAQNNPLIKKEGTDHYSISRGGGYDNGAPRGARCPARRSWGFDYTKATAKDGELGFRLVRLE